MVLARTRRQKTLKQSATLTEAACLMTSVPSSSTSTTCTPWPRPSTVRPKQVQDGILELGIGHFSMNEGRIISSLFLLNIYSDTTGAIGSRNDNQLTTFGQPQMSPPKRPADEKITQVIEKKILIHLHPGNDTDGRHPVNSPVEVGSWNPMIYKVVTPSKRWLALGFLKHLSSISPKTRPLEVRKFLLETIIFRGKMLVWGKVPS